MTKRPKCTGLLGWIFGHRFTVNVGDYAYKTDFCGRCGMDARMSGGASS